MAETDEEDETDLLVDTKTIINSLVIPHPRGLTLKMLCQDYKEIEGKQRFLAPFWTRNTKMRSTLDCFPDLRSRNTLQTVGIQ